jgi:hypothetical protein
MEQKTIKVSAGEWYQDEQGQWKFRATVKKRVKTIEKVKTTRIDLDAVCDGDEISDPDILKESGGHVDEDGNFIEDDD